MVVEIRRKTRLAVLETREKAAVFEQCRLQEICGIAGGVDEIRSDKRTTGNGESTNRQGIPGRKLFLVARGGDTLRARLEQCIAGAFEGRLDCLFAAVGRFCHVLDGLAHGQVPLTLEVGTLVEAESARENVVVVAEQLLHLLDPRGNVSGRLSGVGQRGKVMQLAAVVGAEGQVIGNVCRLVAVGEAFHPAQVIQVERIQPAVAELVDLDLDRAIKSHHAERANVRVAANQLRHGSEILEELIGSSGLLVVGAHYSLETGLVDFFDGVPGGG